MKKACPVLSSVQNTPEFISLKEKFLSQARNIEFHLLLGLSNYRSMNDLEDNWYPVTEEDDKNFSDCLYRWTHGKLKQKSLEELKDLYTKMYTIFTPEQLRERVKMITYDFWSVVNHLQEKDRTGRDRIEIIKSYEYNGKTGYKAILDNIFDQYDEWATEQSNVIKFTNDARNEGREITDEVMAEIRHYAHKAAELWKPTAENKDMLSAIALPSICKNEGFTVRVDGLEVDYSKTSEEPFVDDMYDDNNDEDGNDDTEGSKGERFRDFRTLKIDETLSTKARQALFGIPQKDAEGNIVRNDLRIIPKYLDVRVVATALKDIAADSDSETFLDDIKEMIPEKPWLLGVWERLSSDPDKAATVYSALKGNEQTYVATILENGRYKLIVLNSKARGKQMMAEAGRNITGGLLGYDKGYSIVNEDGKKVSKEEFEEIGHIASEFHNTIPDEIKNLQMLDDYGYEENKIRMRDYLDARPEVCAEYARQLRGVGFDVSAKNVYNMALQSIGNLKSAKKHYGLKGAKYGANKLWLLSASLDRLIHRAEVSQSLTGDDIYGLSSKEYSDVSNLISLSKISELESRVVNEGKSLQTVTNVNLLHQTFNKLAQMSKEDIRAKVLCYEGMGLGHGDELRGTGWLAGDSCVHRVYDAVGFNHREYGKMSVQQKMTNSILNYFISPSNINEFAALYEVCIQSDYDTAYNFVEGARYSKEGLIKAAADEVLVELERIEAIQKRINDDNRIKYDVYERQGQRITTFPELNNNGFIEEYNRLKNETGLDSAYAFLRSNIEEQLNKIAERDARYFEDKGIFRNKYLDDLKFRGEFNGSIYSFYAENGKFDSLNEESQNALKLMFMNYYYARIQITKLTVGGLAQFDGLADFEKRNMLIHAPHTSLYTTPENNTQKVLYIEDDKQKSYYTDINKKAIKALKDSGKITDEQLNRMLKAYDSIKDTDGQGFRTLDSYRRINQASGNWTDRQESAYQRIKEGKPIASDIEMFFSPIKPVYTGYDEIPAYDNTQKPVRVTVLHKYSEVILLPESLSKYCIQAQSVPMRALSKVAEANKADLMLFTSGVKVGAFSVVKPFDKDKKSGERILKTEDELVKYMNSEIKNHPSSVHTLNLEGFGIAANIEGHGEDDKISISTQAEKECFADIEPGEKATIGHGGNAIEKTNEEIRAIYYKTKAADIMEMYSELRSLFNNSSDLEKIMKDELQTKTYYSREMVFAIEQLREGGTAMPLYSPNIRHNIEQLLASIINKRLTKPRYNGQNLPEATAFGIDVDAQPFEDEMIPGFDKLEIKYTEGPDGVRREYIDTYTTIYDSAFEKYADENGVITPERLWGRDGTGNTEGLVFEGKIPREALYFIAYRTPSDYTHSLFNCRIKGFIAKTGGQMIYMPKDCMVSDGHDYDGDKKRCHFPFIRYDWDMEKMQADYNKLDDSVKERVSFKTYEKRMKASNNPTRDDYLKIFYDAYDFNKTEKKNTKTQRYNGRIQMISAVLSSVAGTSRAMIPGEFEETKVIAKAMYIIRNAENATGKVKDIIDSHKSTLSLYKYLTSLSDYDISKLMDELNRNESPFSASHAAEAYEYIMEPADMIGIYAMYGSTAMMLQRANIYYKPKMTRNGKPYEVDIFNHPINQLYKVLDRNKNYASMGRSHLLCAAVDNPKDAVLGYLNQNPKLASLTNFLQAAGFSEEDIHVLMNQPIMLELTKRSSDVKEEFMYSLMTSMVDELTETNPNLAKFVKTTEKSSPEWAALSEMSGISKDECIEMLSVKYDELSDMDHLEECEKQIAILLTMRHLLTPAQQLTEFVRLMRPESESGTIGTSVSDAIMKKAQLEAFRDDMAEDDFRLDGVQDIIRERNLSDDMSETQLPEVIALNTVMGDHALDLFERYYPEVRKTWRDTASEILGYYDLSSKKQKSRRTSKIVTEMMLWKLFSSKTGFITDEIKAEQTKILKTVPLHVMALNKRIQKARQQLDKNEEITDASAYKLIGNAFISHLMADVNNPIATRRLQFGLNGPAIEGLKDDITAGWNQLMMSGDPDIRQLAIDLFKYNIFSNGLEYGMYEFSHFVPFSVVANTPGYLKALQNMMDADFSGTDKENFIDQYIMNHWNDNGLLYKVNEEDFIDNASFENDTYTLSPEMQPELFTKLVIKPFVVVRSSENNKVMKLYKRVIIDGRATLVPYAKLGYKSDRGQMTLQYNPQIDAAEMKPIISPTRQSMAMSADRLYGDADYSNAPDYPGTQQSGTSSLAKQAANRLMAKLGISEEVARMKPLEEKAGQAAKSNDEELKKSSEPASEEDAEKQRNVNSMMNMFNRGNGMFSIAHVDDDGTVTINKVPVTPKNIIDARKQKVFVELNKKLREILREKGVAVGVLNDAEAMMSLGGVTDFDTAPVVAEGILEMIRLAEGYAGEISLPEEFAHVAIEMLGLDHPLVERLISTLKSNPMAMQEAFGDDYSEYLKLYGQDMDKLAEEAAGKLVAKHLFRQQEIKTTPIRALIRRICDAIKDLFRRFSRDEIQNAIFEANDLASKVAQGMFGGKLIDIMSLDNIGRSDKMYSVKKDLSGKHDVLSKLLKIESKRLSILKKRLGPDAENSKEPSVIATKLQVGKLEAAIENYKTEDAIVTYMNDSLDFLAKMEESLDGSINSGRKANDICKKLNTVRDTLHSFSQAIDAVNDAIIDGEINDSHLISQSIGNVQEVLSRFYVKYERIAKQYFEEMLSNVYGESGVTVTVGKDKGRVITIKEMARKADSDIGFMSRWFHSIADCNDYVLMAVDDYTRNAKVRGRQRALDVRPKIELAVNNLIKETGSRDTSFMFEKKHYDGKAWCNGAEDDGKLHKTGFYIKKDSIAYQHLSPAQKAFYDTFMEIKEEADKCVPDSLLKDNKIIMLRKYTMQKISEAEGLKNKLLVGWDSIKNSVLDMSDSFDPEYEEVAVDFENNKVDRLPLKFLLKGKNEQYDDMTDDVASSLIAYTGMAFEYDEVNSVINELENAKYMASERDITQRTGTKTKREVIDTDPDKSDMGIAFREPFNKKAIDSHAQAALEDFFQMHLYGHIHKAEGTFGKTRISKRKTVDMLNNITSLSQMAINLPQRFANVNTGLTQILIESVGRGHFNFKDLSWAIATYVKNTGDRLVDMGKTDYDNKLSLFAEKFDLHQNNGRNQTNYSKKNISRVINSSLLYAGLTAGEDALALTTSLAIARNYKVRNAEGKIENLWDAYEVKYTDPNNKKGAYLSLKSGYTMADGSSIKDIENKYAKECAAMNFEMQGIYNLDDRSAIQQYAAGSLLIMYRKWIAPSIKRRYGSTKYNAMKGEFEEGYHTTLLKYLRDSIVDAKNNVTEEHSAMALLNIISDIKAVKDSMAMNWDKLSEYEKSNIKRATTELSIVTGLYLSCALSGKIPPKKKENDPEYQPTWWDRQVMSQIFRLRSEIGSQAPTPMMINEALHILRSPFAALGPITSTLNGFRLLTPAPYLQDIKSGRYKGHTKAYKYFRELPIIAAYKKIENFIDPTPLINYYKNEIVY